MTEAEFSAALDTLAATAWRDAVEVLDEGDVERDATLMHNIRAAVMDRREALRREAVAWMRSIGANVDESAGTPGVGWELIFTEAEGEA